MLYTLLCWKFNRLSSVSSQESGAFLETVYISPSFAGGQICTGNDIANGNITYRQQFV